MYVSMKPNYSQHCTQSGVSISTCIFELYMLQVKVNRCNYNSYMDNQFTHYHTVETGAIQIIYITWLNQSCYVFIWSAVQINNISFT